MVTLNLDKIFNPNSVAIIGASDEEGSVGYAIVKNLTQLGYAGKIYLVNIRKPEILGVKTYQRIGQVSEPVDLAMIATPAKTVPDVVEECGIAGVKGVIIVFRLQRNWFRRQSIRRQDFGSRKKIRRKSNRTKLHRHNPSPNKPERHIRG